MNLKQEIKIMIVSLASIYGKDLNEMALVAFSEALSSFPDKLVVSILKDWLKNENRFPMPADIIKKIRPQIDDHDDAQEVAALILTATSRYGYTNPNQAQEYIGELGWEVVKRMGGWQYLCENITTDSIGMWRAQLRDYASTVWKKSARGELELKPQLANSEMSSIGEIVNTFLENKSTKELMPHQSTKD